MWLFTFKSIRLVYNEKFSSSVSFASFHLLSTHLGSAGREHFHPCRGSVGRCWPGGKVGLGVRVWVLAARFLPSTHVLLQPDSGQQRDPQIDRVSDEGLLTGLQMAVFTWYLHGVEREGGRERMLWFLLLRTLIPPRGPTLMTSLNVMTLKAPHPNTIPLGVRASTYEFGRVTIQSVAGNLLELYFI